MKPHEGFWAGVFCPRLALQALLRLLPEPPDGPVAVYDRVRGHVRVVETNRAARAAGVHAGQRLADAQAIAAADARPDSPALRPLARNRAAEQRLLEEIALIAYRYSHQVALAGDGVVLEIGGSLRLHGGASERLLAGLERALRDSGLYVRLGAAPVPAAACLLARHALRVETPRALHARLQDWPLRHLALSANELDKLQGLGLDRVHDVLALPRFERERRLGKALDQHLDRLFGRLRTPLVYWHPPEEFRQRLELPVPSDRAEALLFGCNRLLEQLGAWLDVRDRALSGMTLELHPEDNGARIDLNAGLGRAGFERERLLEILRLKLEPIRLNAKIETLVLRADSTVQRRPPQADLWSGTTINDAWPALLDRLRARVGEDGLRGISPHPDHRPENAWRWTEPGTSGTLVDSPPRPNWLLPEPRPCKVEELRLIDGPERIESGWWDGHDCRRDYWTAHDRGGNRLWIFREYKPRDGWFIHGLFG